VLVSFCEFNCETVCCCCSGCGFVEGEEECREEVRTIVFDKPEETCTLDPRDKRTPIKADCRLLLFSVLIFTLIFLLKSN